MSNFNQIGFKVDSSSDLQNISKLAAKGKSISVVKNKYSLVSDKSDAALWFWYSEKRIECLNPHFNGKTESTVSLVSKEVNSKCENCIRLSGWMTPADDNDPESGLYPFSFSIPNYFQYQEIKFPNLAKVQITAFAQEIKVYRNEAEFNRDNEKLAPYYFFPAVKTSADQKAVAEAHFAGKVEMVKKLKNNLGKQTFYWLVVETYGTKIDVVCESSKISGKIKLGNIISGSFYLSGMIVDLEK